MVDKLNHYKESSIRLKMLPRKGSLILRIIQFKYGKKLIIKHVKLMKISVRNVGEMGGRKGIGRTMW